MKAKYWSAFAVLIFSAFSHAEFEIIPEATMPSVPARSPGAAAPTPVAPGIPLVDALKRIIPKGWRVYAGNDIPDPSFLVEYVPVGDMNNQLSQLSDGYNLVFKLDEKKKAAYVSAAPGGIRARKQPIAGLANKMDAVANQDVGAFAPDGAVRIHINRGEKLSDGLEKFLKLGDWRLQWEAGVDYTLREPLPIEAEDLPTALTKLLSKYRLHARIYIKNRVISVVPNDSLRAS